MAHQQQNTTGHPTSDSFFNRVFGHHSPHDTPRSRTPTSHLTAPRPTTATKNSSSSSRHSRNSSVGTLQTTSPTVSDLSIARRRRSFDGRESLETSKNAESSQQQRQQLGAPPLRLVTSVSSNTPGRSNDGYPHNKSYRERKGSAQESLLFPRSDRESSFGSDSDSTTARRRELRRRNSGEPVKCQYQAFGTATPPPTTTTKKRLFRFGKRKTGNSTDSSSNSSSRQTTRAAAAAGTEFDPTSSTTSLASSVPSNSSTLYASTTPSIASSVSSSNNNRKKSGDNLYRMIPAHPLDLAFTDGHMRYPQPLNTPVHPTERRKDQHSHHHNRKGRDKERNDVNSKDHHHNYHHHHHHGGKPKLMKDIELDQNFGSMDGIVNLDYYSMLDPSSAAKSKRTGLDRRGSDTTAEQWAPPDSWGVQLPVLQDGGNNVIGTQLVADDESTLFEEYAIEDQEKWDVPKKNFCVRIFRPDGTFATVQVPVNITTVELLNKLAGKFFLPDMSKYNLMIRRHNQERILHPNERPIHIQKTLLEQMGYTEQDRIEELGLEDNSYLLRFSFGPNLAQMLHEDPEMVVSRDVDLQGRNLPTIPIFLYKYASQITSLDLSRNLLVEIPVDFAQMCRSLKHLSFADNEYPNVPISIRHIASLESLDISGNRIKDVQQAHLEDLSKLQILKAYNNRLETLPTCFAAFEHLSILLLSNNSFTTFPDVLCHIVCLQHLDISFNKISTLPDEIGDLTNLVHFYATANRLAGALPPSFGRLKKLEKLDIRQNLISNFDVLSELDNLQVLLADFNSTSEISFESRNLQRLDMYKNHLTHFNICPSRSPCNLKELNLSNCKLSSLPDDMFISTANLEILVLDCNTLTALPSSIGQLKKLERLSVQANNLEVLPEEIAKLSDLKTLDVQKNNLKTLPKEIWLCSSLQTLNCSSNLLESFPQPYSAPGIALHLPIPPESENNVVAAAAAPSVVLDNSAHLGTNVGQGIVPTTKTHDLTGTGGGDLSVRTPQAMPNFNPPSFFASPRNHPPPLSLSLRNLFLGDNRLTDEVWAPLSWFIELRILNLSFNYLTEMLPEGFFHQHLLELYISGNHLTSLPADDIEKLSYLRVLAVNGNKLQTVPAEIGKLRRLVVLDVGNNTLKYNISNWPYDWNWNWNLGLKYLNFSGNKRLEIKRTHPDHNNPKEKDLSDFSALTRLRMLGLMDITMLGVSVLEEYHDRRIRTSPSEVNGMSYGVADWLGPNDHLGTWDLVMPKFGNRDDESIFALFDGRKQSKTGCKLTKFLYDNFTYYFMNELRRNKQDDTIVSAMRRTFLSLEKGLATSLDEVDSGASAVICYIAGHKLHVANVGDAIAVISRNNGQASEITQKHIPLNPSETSRIRAAGGFVSNEGRLNGELQVSRSFGHFHLIPALNANPYVSTIMLTEDDEFVIMASRGLWDHMSYQTAVDIARTEKDDMMAAAQKLRDFAITYGAQSNLMVMVIKISDIFDKRDKQHRTLRGNLGAGRGNQAGAAAAAAAMAIDEKYKRRGGKDESPGDSTLARLDREVPPPTNQVALVFTDIKSSTHFWETQPESMRAAIKIHDYVMRRTLRSVGGYEVKTEGDAFMVCFQNITAALLWCFTVQLQLLQVDWPAGILDTEDGREIEKDNVVIYKGLSVRMGIHWGMPVFERNPITNRMDYFGPVVNKASRICNAADGGQICVSSDVVAALRNFYGVFDNEAAAAEDQATPASSSLSMGGTIDNSIVRETQQLKRLGFHIVELGERRLKGLETPEMLSLVYPKQLAGRMELDKMASTSVSAPPPAPPPLKPAAAVESSSSSTPTPPPESSSRAVAPVRTIDPSLICALSDLAIRLERITAGSLQKRRAESPEGVITASTGLGRWLDRHMRENASDEELMAFMENFVARVENAVSTLYLQKVGQFAGVLEKLGEAIEVDPMHVLRALQMYSEVAGLDDH